MNTRRSNARGGWTAPAQQHEVLQEQVDDSYMEEQYNEPMMQEDPVQSHEGDAVKTEGGPKKQKSWIKYGPDGKRIKHKPNLKKRNAVFRKALQPKTALMCLNELEMGLKFDVEAMAPMGQYTATVMVKGQEYRGYGTCKASAKQAAAEAALVSYVKPPAPKGQQADGEDDDDTPWKTIASFAMYKLFADWSEGKIAGASMNVNNQASFNTANYSDMRDYINAGPQQHGMMPQQQQPMQPNNMGQYLNQTGKVKSQLGVPSNLKPAKKMKEELKVSSHPVMVLHQLVPDIKYEVSEELNLDGSNSKTFTLTSYVNSVPYSGQGSSTKKAKFQLAKMVLKEVFDIENTYEPTN